MITIYKVNKKLPILNQPSFEGLKWKETIKKIIKNDISQPELTYQTWVDQTII